MSTTISNNSMRLEDAQREHRRRRREYLNNRRANAGIDRDNSNGTNSGMNYRSARQGIRRQEMQDIQRETLLCRRRENYAIRSAANRINNQEEMDHQQSQSRRERARYLQSTQRQQRIQSSRTQNPRQASIVTTTSTHSSVNEDNRGWTSRSSLSHIRIEQMPQFPSNFEYGSSSGIGGNRILGNEESDVDHQVDTTREENACIDLTTGRDIILPKWIVRKENVLRQPIQKDFRMQVISPGWKCAVAINGRDFSKVVARILKQQKDERVQRNALLQGWDLIEERRPNHIQMNNRRRSRIKHGKELYTFFNIREQREALKYMDEREATPRRVSQ